MKIYLMRHGQTTGDIEDRFGGDYDDHLTQKGQIQAKVLAEKIDDFKIEKIFSSPKIRAVETAQILNDVTHVPIEIIGNLRERNAYRILTGKLKSEVKEAYPLLIEQLKDPKATIESAEEYNDFKNRVINIFNTLAAGQENIIGIVTHGGVISCFLREIIGRERKKLDDCALIQLDFKNNQFNLISSEGLELE